LPQPGVKAREGSQDAKKRTKADAVLEQTRAAKRRFDAANEKGMAALRRRDRDGLTEAIAEEKAAILSLPINRKKK
jgi:hypothetical protein